MADDTGPAEKRRSLAGRLGSIPHAPRSEKPRAPKIARPHASAPPAAGRSKPRPVRPNKPARPDVPQRASAARAALPPTRQPRGSVSRRLGSFARAEKRGR